MDNKVKHTVRSFKQNGPCIAKVPTLRSRSKTAVSFATIENNEPADAKNSKDTVMSGVDRELGRIQAKERRILRTERIGEGRKTEGCAARMAKRHKGRKLGRGHKGTSNQLSAVDERDFGSCFR